MFLIEPTPDASVYVSVQGQMLGCSSLGMAAGSNRRRRDFCVACMHRKRGECRKPSENVNRLASYRFFVLRKKGSKTKERMKEEEIEKDDCGPPTRKVFFWFCRT